MRHAMVWMLVIGMVLVFSGVVSAQQKGPAEAVAQGIVESVAKGCDKEIKTYCKDVTPGEGRLIQCIDKNDAKVSKRCKQALKDTGLKK